MGVWKNGKSRILRKLNKPLPYFFLLVSVKKLPGKNLRWNLFLSKVKSFPNSQENRPCHSCLRTSRYSDIVHNRYFLFSWHPNKRNQKEQTHYVAHGLKNVERNTCKKAKKMQNWSYTTENSISHSSHFSQLHFIWNTQIDKLP